MLVRQDDSSKLQAIALSNFPIDSTHVGIPNSPPAPVPLITRDDLAHYSSSLAAKGWHFRQATKTLETPNCTATWWQLHHNARFPSFKAAMAYVNDVADLAKANKVRLGNFLDEYAN